MGYRTIRPRSRPTAGSGLDRPRLVRPSAGHAGRYRRDGPRGHGRREGRCVVQAALNVVVNREVEASGEEHYWALATTRQWDHPGTITELYGLRSSIEERHRQLKCFQDLASFRSRAFSLVVHQVVFVLLTYTLLQWQLVRREKAALNRKTLPRVREILLPAAEQVALFYQQSFALLSVLEYQEVLLTLSEEARLKILQKTRELRRAMYELPGPRRGPP